MSTTGSTITNNRKTMTNEDKAKLYDDCIRESDRLQRENSKIKSEYAGNIPSHLDNIIRTNEARIAVLVRKLEGLFD